MNTTKKNIPVNPTVKYDSLLALVSRIDTLQKSDIAEKWIKANTVITQAQRYHLLTNLYFQKSLVYDKLEKVARTHKIGNPHRIVIPGVRELKVG